MADFTVRSDAVNVEQIMEQIRARIREKRGVDYTEEQIRELAAVKLQKFLDPRGVRSDLLEQFRKTQPPYEPPQLPNFAFEDSTLFESHRGPLRFIRRLLRPILKLFFNPNPLIQALHIQSKVNTMLAEREARLEASRRSTESLYYELIHNLVLETTRLGIEVKNLTMRVESLSSRQDFNERRARALESAVVYKGSQGSQGSVGSAGAQGSLGSGSPGSPGSVGSAGSAGSAVSGAAGAPGGQMQPPTPGAGEGPGQRSRRRRRRRGRRSGPPAAVVMGGTGSPAAPAAPAAPHAQSTTAETVQQAIAVESHSTEPAPAAPAPQPSVDAAPPPAPPREPDSQ